MLMEFLAVAAIRRMSIAIFEIGKVVFNIDRKEIAENSKWKEASNTWKGICSTWDALKHNTFWRVGDGHSIRFWTDSWIPKVGVLLDKTLAPLREFELDMRVKDFANSDGSWNVSLLKRCLPTNIVDQISLIMPPQNGTSDSVAWNCTNDGKFSVCSAYNVLTGNLVDDDLQVFKLVWSWTGPERVRVMLWKVAADILPTNLFRKGRHVAQNALCPLCGLEDESTLHALRDFVEAQQLWICLVTSGLDPLLIAWIWSIGLYGICVILWEALTRGCGRFCSVVLLMLCGCEGIKECLKMSTLTCFLFFALFGTKLGLF
ncbi:hypothetical protein RIF29_13828 [Crotalaria pallida]|uniref:Reverse transcriptase zinc-binding domain-containing protein n=1 Tax=Crotalaria pallida TaxID=3830 RepID=A0AAN9FAM9_CROPI